ncbi:DUF397 domain-containing protein [Streptomyces sp. C10-9-1]|uniref:DUF397 domain-containing protein n=1 Tax=Streptomyces sp. C10-9-1 TaxID=1859285 RepID=UPI003F4A3ADF
MKTKVGTPGAGLVWIKSSYSSEEGGECVEVAERPGSIHVRDSKDTNRPGFVVDASVWTAFVGFASR